MPEYIEREALLKDIDEELECEVMIGTKEQNECVNKGLRIARKDIASFPTADVVEVVRCDKCKCYEEMQSENAHFCNRFGGYVTEHDYCSRAEKKEGAGE